MVNDRALQDFKTQVAIGVSKPQLQCGAFAPSPAGAFDQMPPELSPSVMKGLDALSRDSARQVHDYLRKRLGRDQDPSVLPSSGMPQQMDQEEPDWLERLCAILEESNVPDDTIRKVREMAAGLGGDGTLHITHRGVTGDDVYSTPTPAGSEPPTFRGQPHTGGTMTPISDRRAALRNMSRIKTADQAGHLYRASSGFTPQEPKPMAMDSASRAGFLRRFPDAARIKFA
jgi:hypothetical protein